METKFNFKSQVSTSCSQSERLLALGLKKETADFYTPIKLNPDKGSLSCLPDFWTSDEPFIKKIREASIPAWSLHRLLCMLPRCVDGGYHLAISYDHIEYRTTYNEVTTWWRGGGNTYDMIIETIEWLIKEGYFNKEYLEE